MRRTFIELVGSIQLVGFERNFGLGFFLTDNNGSFSASFDVPPIPFISFDVTQFALRVHCHNSTIRVVKAGALDLRIIVDRTMGNGGTVIL